jgi:hypothetical protein
MMDQRTENLRADLAEIDPRLGSWVTILAGAGESYDAIMERLRRVGAKAAELRAKDKA